MSVVGERTTFERVLELLRDGCWHTEQELTQIAYFPRYWIDELKTSGYSLQTRDNNGLQLRLR